MTPSFHFPRLAFMRRLMPFAMPFYWCAHTRGCETDQPCSLAQSVQVQKLDAQRTPDVQGQHFGTPASIARALLRR